MRIYCLIYATSSHGPLLSIYFVFVKVFCATVIYYGPLTLNTISTPWVGGERAVVYNVYRAVCMCMCACEFGMVASLPQVGPIYRTIHQLFRDSAQSNTLITAINYDLKRNHVPGDWWLPKATRKMFPRTIKAVATITLQRKLS